MNKKFAVIGLGVFGSAIARKLAERGADVMAIDENEERVQHLAQEVAFAVTLDATNLQALEAQNLRDGEYRLKFPRNAFVCVSAARNGCS